MGSPVAEAGSPAIPSVLPATLSFSTLPTLSALSLLYPDPLHPPYPSPSSLLFEPTRKCAQAEVMVRSADGVREPS